MKKITFLIVGLLLFQFSMYAQSTYKVCTTRSQSTQQNITPATLHLPTTNFASGNYNIAIRVHRIRQSNGSGGVTDTSI